MCNKLVSVSLSVWGGFISITVQSKKVTREKQVSPCPLLLCCPSRKDLKGLRKWIEEFFISSHEVYCTGEKRTLYYLCSLFYVSINQEVISKVLQLCKISMTD